MSMHLSYLLWRKARRLTQTQLFRYSEFTTIFCGKRCCLDSDDLTSKAFCRSRILLNPLFLTSVSSSHSSLLTSSRGFRLTSQMDWGGKTFLRNSRRFISIILISFVGSCRLNHRESVWISRKKWLDESLPQRQFYVVTLVDQIL